MEDKELLEYAAKAAGLKIWRWLKGDIPQIECSTHQIGPVWNPLTDDGDALRLAVKCGISIAQEVSNGCVFCDVAKTNPNIGIDEDYGGDPYAATRRAIVRTAAEIGRSM